MSEPTSSASTHEVEHEVRIAFHNRLDAIDDDFVRAGLMVADALPRLSEAFLSGDRGVIERADAMADDVSRRCAEIEDTGFVLLAREAPVAGDLRRLVALLRMTVDVSRSASLLRHACHTLRQFDPRFLEPTVRAELEEMSRQASAVFVAGMDAWRRRDALAVTEVDDADESVDELQRVLLREVARTDDPGPELVVLGLLARYFERIADHGVEIARDAAFVATGQRVPVGRHREASSGDEDAGPGRPPTGGRGA
jgi:phosphate transport system protein